MHLPLDKEFLIKDNDDDFLESYQHMTELPIGRHLGAFGARRKNHIHEGIDLYCMEGDIVYAMFDGVVENVLPFTGEIANSPWWNDTWCIMIDHGNFTINYGEISPLVNIGDFVHAGDVIGSVTRVLKKDKGRPTTMLHLELYTKGTLEPIVEWSLDEEQPPQLLDPTSLFI